MTLGLIRLMRPYYALPLSCGFIVILLYLRGGTLEGIQNIALWSVAALACLISGADVLNDIFDIEVDRINSPRRPLPSGHVTLSTAIALAVVLFVSSLACAAMCGGSFLLGITIVAAILITYDICGKRMGLVRNFLVAAAAVSLYPLAFALADPVQTPRLNVLYIHPAWFFLTALGYEMLKDIRDRSGDALISRRKYAFDKWFHVLARMVLITASLIALLPFLLGYCGIVYLTAAIISLVLYILACRLAPVPAIRLIYAAVALITLGSLLDIL
jgi:geranylgeranylglycerol-phosphate geranylgeranyltransferase